MQDTKLSYRVWAMAIYILNTDIKSGMESFWSLLKRGYYGTYHRMSPEHLQRYIDEFVGRHNIRGLDTIEQMEETAKGLVRKLLTYKMLTRKVGKTARA